jgi:hypothetical protein
MDDHGQPVNPAFNYYRNRNKALLSLRGILEGIAADGTITTEEQLFLATWMDENNSLFQNKLLFQIGLKAEKLLSMSSVTVDDVRGIMAAIDYLIAWEVPLQANFGPDSMHEVLIGVCRGIDSDRKLDDDEISYLGAFLTENPHLQHTWPASELYLLIREIMKDGKITPEERIELQAYIRSLFGDGMKNGVSDGLSTTLPLDYGIGIEFPERIFCLTGKFLHGTRKECQELIEAKGGEVTDRVNQFVHYLVVGTMSSLDWKYSSFGRKIERAVESRDEKGFPIRIVSEEMWLGAL